MQRFRNRNGEMGFVGRYIFAGECALLTLLFCTTGVVANQASGCAPMWDYPTDTWRLHPDSLVVDKSDVVVKWHIDDIYIPGSPDASADLHSAIAIQIDNGPMFTEDIFQLANQLTPRKFRITNLKRGQHKLKVSFSASFFNEYFSSCFSTPSHSSITRWYMPGEAIPTH